MKLKTYNGDNCIIGGRGIVHPRISFCLDTGIIRLNRKMVDLCQFKNGDLVAISQDENKPENWYLHRDNRGFALSADKSGKKKSMTFFSKDLVSRILEITHFRNEACTIGMNMSPEPIEIDGVDYYEIATKTAHISSYKKRI